MLAASGPGCADSAKATQESCVMRVANHSVSSSPTGSAIHGSFRFLATSTAMSRAASAMPV